MSRLKRHYSKYLARLHAGKDTAYRIDPENPMGSWLHHLRRRDGWTLREVADSTGLSVGNLCDLENGLQDNPRLSTLRALAKCYGVSLGEVAGENVWWEET